MGDRLPDRRVLRGAAGPKHDPGRGRNAVPEPVVSVVICTRNRSADLARALDSLARQGPGGPSFEVIVVDNGSTDDTRDTAARFASRSPALYRRAAARADRFDAVAQVEIASESAAGLLVERPLDAGTNIRAAGEDVREGDCAAAGRAPALELRHRARGRRRPCRAAVTRRPGVAILPTGGELRPPGTLLAPGEVADADGPMLQALAREAGADCERLPARPDDAGEIGAAVLGAVATSDLVLVIAGSSRGRADHTAAVLEQHGELVAHGVALRPAHPVALGVVEGTPVIGIPGYPSPPRSRSSASRGRCSSCCSARCPRTRR